MALDSFLRVDTYSWRARIAPVLVALLPVPLAVFICFPGSSVVARIVAILGAPALRSGPRNLDSGLSEISIVF